MTVIIMWKNKTINYNLITIMIIYDNFNNETKNVLLNVNYITNDNKMYNLSKIFKKLYNRAVD